MTTQKQTIGSADIPQDAFVTVLMHTVMNAANKDDLAEFKRESKQETIRLEDKLERRIDKLESKIDNRFKWTLALMFGGFFTMTGVLLKFLH